MRLLHTAIKMCLVGIIASLAARALSLDYWLTGGLIAILSIHLTKRDSLVIALRRMIDAIYGMMLATLMFIAFGYEFWVFSIFLFIFIYTSFVLKISEGIILSLVLVTHLLAFGSFSFDFFIEELLLVTVSVSIALLFNIVYPTSSEKELNEHVESIDQMLRDHLFMLSILLRDPEYHDEYYRHFSMLNRKLTDTIDIVELVDKDLLFNNDHSYLAYFHMRKEQISYVRHMYQQALKIKMKHPFALEVSDFVRALSYDIGVYNRAIPQLKKLDLLQQSYKEKDLPLTREEFETRAMLFQILNEIESFLMVKVDFHHAYPDFKQEHLS